MIVRELGADDLARLLEFVIDAYNEYPQAMWFDTEPSAEEIERVFYSKMKGIASGALVDIVADDKGTLIGECEIARIAHDSGVIGIIVRHGYRGKGIGTRLLKEAMGLAGGIGMRKFSAEIDEGNKKALKFFVANGFAPEGYRDVKRNNGMRRVVVVKLAP